MGKYWGFLKSAYKLLPKDAKQNKEVEALFESVRALVNNEQKEKEDKEMKAFLRSVGILKQRVYINSELVKSQEKKKDQTTALKLSEDCQNDIDSFKLDVKNA